MRSHGWGAWRTLMAALKAEAAEYVEQHREERDETGTGGAQRPGPGAQVKLGRGNSGAARAAGERFAAVMNRASVGASPAGSCRPTCARSPKVAELLPMLCLLHGRFPPRAGRAAARRRGRVVADQHRAADRLLGERVHLPPAELGRERVCLCLGGRRALQHPTGGRPAPYPGNDRGAAQQRERVARWRGRPSGER